MKRRLGFALSAVLLAGLVIPASGSAATTVGATPPPTATAASDCNADSAHVTGTLSGVPNPYVATASGVITEWQFQGDAIGNHGTIAMQTLQEGAASGNFAPLLETAAESPVANQLNAFDTRIPIAAGQSIGLRTITFSHGCFYSTSSGDYTDFGETPAPLPGSGEQSYGIASASAATNVAATIEADADKDGFGDETQDGCLGNAARSDDCVKPGVTIDRGPRKQSRKRRAKFVFSSDEPAATFECSVDGRKFKACSSPLKLKRLKRRRHTFSVRAIDANGNQSAEADYKWKVKKRK